MQVEDVARIRLPARRTPQQERDLAVGRGVLRKVVVDAEGVLAVVAEVFAHRAARVGGEVEEGRGLRSAGRHDDRVLEGPELLEGPRDLGHGRLLLADGHVDADDVLALLVDDRVHRDRGLSRLAIADDQLALAAADRHHAVDGLEAGLERLLHRLTVHHPGGQGLDRVPGRGRHRSLAVDGLAEGVHDPAHQGIAHGNGHDALRPLGLVPLLDEVGVSQEHGPDRVFLEVQGQGHDPVGKLEQLAGHALVEAVNAGDPVARREHGAGLGHVHPGREAPELLLDDAGDLVGANLHDSPALRF